MAPITRYIAFLRAINVGGHVVKMDALRALFSSLRFASVETFIASGNVIFDSASADAPALEQEIESLLAQKLGYAVATFLRTPVELAAVVALQPFGDDNPLGPTDALWVGFMKSPPPAAQRRALLALATDVDDFRIAGREIFWRRQTSVRDSNLSGTRLEKILGSPSTFRNITTVRKLAAAYPP